MKRQLVKPIAILIASLFVTGCTTAKFAVANLAAATESFDRTTGLAYGTVKRQRLDVYLPQPRPATRSPVVVFFYGGGWDSGSKDRYQFVGGALAAHGYVAVLPDYRLYPEVRFPAFLEDAAQAVAWVHAHAGEYGGDPNRIFLMGHSAGAHIAMLLALDEHYLRDAGSSAGDLSGVIGLSGPYDFLPLGSGFQHAVFDATADLALTQPIHFVRANAPPVLLLQGTADKTVRPANSEHLAAALRAAGAHATLKLYEGKRHADTVAAFSNLRRGAPPVLADIADFIAVSIAQAAPDSPEKVGGTH